MSPAPTVLVTGAEGLLGRHIVRKLLDAPIHRTIAVGRNASPAVIDHLTWVRADLRDPMAVQALAAFGADVIVHAAAVLPTTLDDAAAANANQDLDTNIFSLARSTDAALIYLSSQSVYERCATPWTESLIVQPISAYAAGKYRSEIALKELGLPTAALRISSPYSATDPERKGVLYHFAREAVAARPLTVLGRGLRAQDFVHGMDVARAVMAIILHWQSYPASPPRADTFNIARGTPVSMSDLAELVVECAGSGEVVHTGVEDEADYRAELSVSRAWDILGWRPRVGLRAGLDQLIRHLRGAHEDWLVV